MAVRAHPGATTCRDRNRGRLFRTREQELHIAGATRLHRDLDQWAERAEAVLWNLPRRKGLEFDTVFLPFLSSKCWPRPADVSLLGQDEAAVRNARLLYVAGHHACKIGVGAYVHETGHAATASERGLVSVMAKTVATIKTEAERRGITRLCHFTPSRNLAHIASDPKGILASRHLLDDEKIVFNPTDRERLDGHKGHVCCSIQYPNAWYFRTARGKEVLFRDWGRVLHQWAAIFGICTRSSVLATLRRVW